MMSSPVRPVAFLYCVHMDVKWVFAEYQLDLVLSDSTVNPELSDNWRHMKAVWSVLGV